MRRVGGGAGLRGLSLFGCAVCTWSPNKFSCAKSTFILAICIPSFVSCTCIPAIHIHCARASTLPCTTKYVYRYKEYHSVSTRRNWDSPNPSLASECAPPPRTGEGLGDAQFRRLEKKLRTLPTLCPVPYILYMDDMAFDRAFLLKSTV